MKTERHICTVCNFIYEAPCSPEECGCDASFEALPEQWLCPGCGGDKDKYQPCSCIKVTVAENAEANNNNSTFQKSVSSDCQVH